MNALIIEYTNPELNQTQSNLTLPDDIERDFRISSKTAIGRKKVSAPLQILIDKKLFDDGTILHYGKGRTTLDSPALAELGLRVFDYDYVHCYKPELLGSNYNNIYCGYVVNTLPPAARAHVYQQLASACPKGKVIIAARSDAAKGTPELDGVRTSIGTFQKQYFKGQLKAEAEEYFESVQEIRGKSGMTIVLCQGKRA